MLKKEKERKKREAKEAEEALKREREMECQSEIYLKRLQQRMVETEARSGHRLSLSLSLLMITLCRLQKQKKELEDRKYLERVEMESKLADIATQRHRTKDIFLIPPPVAGAAGGGGGDGDDKSKASNGSSKRDKASALPNIKKSKGVELTSDTPQVT
jgi:hypothetical protein